MTSDLMTSDLMRKILKKLGELSGFRPRSNSAYSCIRQDAEEDCGAACIATVSAQHGKSLSISRVREAVGTTATGTTLLGLKRGAESLGFNARAAKADGSLLTQLHELPLPVICHWDGSHWVVVHGREGSRVIVADPAVGLLHIEMEEFVRHWSNGVLLLLEPDPSRFANLEEDRHPGIWVFLRYLKPFRPLLGQALILNMLIGLLALAMPLLMQVLTDDVLVRGDSRMLTSLGIGIMVLFMLRSALTLVQGHMVGHFGQKLQLQMVLHYGNRLLKLPIDYFESHRSGEVVSRISDIQLINDLLTDVVLGLPSQFGIALISLIWMWMYNPTLTMVALACYLIVIACNLSFLPAIQDKTRQLLVRSADNQGFLVEVFRAANVLKTTDATEQAWQEYQHNFGRLANLRWRALKLGLGESTLTGLLGSLSTIALLWVGSSFVISRELSIGQLLAFNGMGVNVLGFLAGLSGITQETITAQVVVRRLAEVLEREVEDPHSADKHPVSISPSDDITCKGLRYHHPGRLPLMEDFNLHIPGGITTALIGESGCGKSSLSKLLAGLYPLQHGSIHYGPYSSRDLCLDSLRRQVVLIPQDSEFFNRSIFDNFSFAHPGINFEQVVAACRLALADEFIRDLPDGYRTVLGEFGANLSGGQRQRLAIARSLIGDPAVLIMDESTSALDPVLEGRLMDQLLEHRRGRTTLLISHRPSVILRADWIVFMEKGCVRFQDQPAALKERVAVAPYLSAA
jgi:ABC-type bacteriocin/lantibiotic exporter with double-glycine peptidase domain